MGTADYSHPLLIPWEQLQTLVKQICIRRRALLLQQGVDIWADREDNPPGRFLAFDTLDSLSDGAANVTTGGFFDDDNFPPWEFWLTTIEQEKKIAPGELTPFRTCLVCWIPAALVDLVERGIDAIPEQSIQWLENIPRYT
jgi:hypothetical protein